MLLITVFLKLGLYLALVTSTRPWSAACIPRRVAFGFVAVVLVSAARVVTHADFRGLESSELIWIGLGGTGRAAAISTGLPIQIPIHPSAYASTALNPDENAIHLPLKCILHAEIYCEAERR